MIDPDEESDRIRDEALELVLKLATQPRDESLRGELEVWRRRSSEHERAYRRVAEAWLLGGEASQEDGAAEAVRTAGRSHASGVHRVRDEPAPSSRRPRRRAVLSLVSAAAAMGIALLVGPTLRMQIEADHLTGAGEVRTFELEDGSLVDLGSASAVAVAYSPEERSVELLAGKAFFDVRRQPDRPFTVQAAGLGIQVTGTAFAVSQGQRSTTVAVESGRLDVTLAGAPETAVLLEKGDRLILDEVTGEVQRDKVPHMEIAAWRRGLVLADRMPFGELLYEIDRYHRGITWIASRRLEHGDVTGVFDLRDPVTALIAAAETQNAEVTQVSPFLRVVTAR